MLFLVYNGEAEFERQILKCLGLREVLPNDPEEEDRGGLCAHPAGDEEIDGVE